MTTKAAVPEIGAAAFFWEHLPKIMLPTWASHSPTALQEENIWQAAQSFASEGQGGAID
jgi:hypothetical protein